MTTLLTLNAQRLRCDSRYARSSNSFVSRPEIVFPRYSQRSPNLGMSHAINTKRKARPCGQCNVRAYRYSRRENHLSNQCTWVYAQRVALLHGNTRITATRYTSNTTQWHHTTNNSMPSKRRDFQAKGRIAQRLLNMIAPAALG